MDLLLQRDNYGEPSSIAVSSHGLQVIDRGWGKPDHRSIAARCSFHFKEPSIDFKPPDCGGKEPFSEPKEAFNGSKGTFIECKE
jgi:hypothetical protein